MADGFRTGEDAVARLAALLDPWWRALGGDAPACALVPAAALPDAARALLDHRGSMTLALEARWRSPIGVRRLAEAEEPGTLTRVSVLHTADGLPVELAVIRMVLRALPPALHADLRGATTPFGRLLAHHGIAFSAEPRAFFRLEADAVGAAHGAVPAGTPLYGRHNRIVASDGSELCEVVEILPRA